MGWVSQVLGLMSIGGGVVAMHFANREYNDTERYRKLAQAETLGYGLGGSLIGMGIGLVMWDVLRHPNSISRPEPCFWATVFDPPDAVNTEILEGSL